MIALRSTPRWNSTTSLHDDAAAAAHPDSTNSMPCTSIFTPSTGRAGVDDRPHSRAAQSGTIHPGRFGSRVPSRYAANKREGSAGVSQAPSPSGTTVNCAVVETPGLGDAPGGRHRFECEDPAGCANQSRQCDRRIPVVGTDVEPGVARVHLLLKPIEERTLGPPHQSSRIVVPRSHQTITTERSRQHDMRLQLRRQETTGEPQSTTQRGSPWTARTSVTDGISMVSGCRSSMSRPRAMPNSA